jgi:hypothetical protein
MQEEAEKGWFPERALIIKVALEKIPEWKFTAVARLLL